MQMLRFQVDHVTIERSVFKFTTLIKLQMKKRKCRAGACWPMDETYIRK